MKNEDYFKYIKNQSYVEKLRAFAQACESEVKHYYESNRNGIGEDNRAYHLKESEGQSERIEFLFQELIKDYEGR